MSYQPWVKLFIKKMASVKGKEITLSGRFELPRVTLYSLYKANLGEINFGSSFELLGIQVIKKLLYKILKGFRHGLLAFL